MTMTEEKPWSGRFTAPTDAFVEAFTASIAFDKRLYAQDIRGSIAHARMLAQAGVLTPTEAEQIVAGLQQVRAEIEAGEMAFSAALEDIHMHVETRLTQLIGEVGKKLHTGRSRNDQVATDVRLYTREAIDEILAGIARLETALMDAAEREADTIMPGFTHLQVAQPVTFGHHLMAYVEMLHRDGMRLLDARKRVNVLPLGAAALAGTTFPIDRWYVAHELGFDFVAENSLDAVSDRDFAIETVAAIALMMVHLSRFAEELILWSSPSFGFIELSDSFCTGSSIMPQKKNPDVPELVRGKSARVIGALQTLLVLMKAQPLAYNKDNQEDKEPLFDALDTARGSLKVFAEMLPGMMVRREAMRVAALRGFATATDLADYLVRKGLPFRAAHEVVGKAVRLAVEQGCNLEDLSLEALRGFSPLIDADVYQVLTLEGSVEARGHIGGTAPAQVRQAIARARTRLADWGI
ncbi:MAG: argininosuccinate lyase [Pseudomonadota bacterium]